MTRIKIEDDPALGHDYQPEEGSYFAATCTADGKEEDLKCTRCGIVITGDVIPALGHDYKEVEGSGIDPTCTDPGREADMKCSRCGDQTEGEDASFSLPPCQRGPTVWMMCLLLSP